MSQAAVQITIHGLVQGVGYRYYCLRLATDLQLTGWVKNETDGSVVVYAEGDRQKLETLVDQLRVGPSNAAVRDVQVQWGEFTRKYSSFNITR